MNTFKGVEDDKSMFAGLSLVKEIVVNDDLQEVIEVGFRNGLKFKDDSLIVIL